MSGSYVLMKVKEAVFCHRSPLRFINLFLLMLSFFIFPHSSVFARDEMFTWIPPTTNSDGTPLKDLAGFKVYYGTASRTYSKVINAGNVNSYIVSNLSDGTYYFAVTAYNVVGNEGNFSNEVVRTVQSRYTLSVSKSGTGTGTATSTGISCGSDCAEPFAPGTVVTLTAAPDANSTFAGWSGGGCTGTGQCTTTINANTTVTAEFNLKTQTSNTCDTVNSNSFFGCYYDNIDFTNLKLTRTDSQINFEWGYNSPNASIVPEAFSVRWQGDWYFASSGTYRFTATADDGIRIWIDGTLILDKWSDQAPTTYTVDRSLSAGTHRIKVEYYENEGGSVAKLNWKLV
jgi:PA14 domain/Divergent InlB B-repeat domain